MSDAFTQNNEALVSAGLDPVVDFGSPAAADTDGGIDILSQEGREELRRLESSHAGGTEEATNDSGDDLYDGNPFGLPTAAQRRANMREGLVHKILGNEPALNAAFVKAQVADLANFIETGEFETAREHAFKNEAASLQSELDMYDEAHASLDEFLQTHFPKEFARRISSMNLVKELLITGFDLGDEDDDDDDFQGESHEDDDADL